GVTGTAGNPQAHERDLGPRVDDKHAVDRRRGDDVGEITTYHFDLQSAIGNELISPGGGVCPRRDEDGVVLAVRVGSADRGPQANRTARGYEQVLERIDYDRREELPVFEGFECRPACSRVTPFFVRDDHRECS